MCQHRRWLSLISLVITLVAPELRAEDAELQWAAHSVSPHPSAEPRGRDAALYAICGERDMGLVRVAAAVVGRRAEGATPPSERQLALLLHAAGVPQMWPRAWALAGAHDEAVIAGRLQRFVAERRALGLPRCGIARGVGADGSAVVAAVTVDALADQQPLVTRATVSRWISLDASLHVAASGAKVVLLGPRGRPKRVLASLSDGRVRSRFTLDAPGRWKVQVVANLADGPKPVLETLMFAGIDPPAELEDEPAEATNQQVSAGSLHALLNEARHSEGMAPLKRDKALDAVAREHARTMMETRRVAHDVGHGTPDERSSLAGVKAHRVGENVATAPTVSRLHHALWDSPSHRENMLDVNFTRVGVALAVDRSGQLYAVQMFAD